MRPSPLEIKAALLRPERFLRDEALAYFADSFSQDPTILPTVAEALERYGRFEAFDGLWRIANLAVTPESAEWALEHLTEVPLDGTPGRREAQFGFALIELIQGADPAWQIAQAERLSAQLPKQGEFFRSWQELDRLDDEGLWQALEQLSRDLRNSWDISDADADRSFQLIELLIRRDAFAERFLAVLERSDEADGEGMPWDEIFAIQWAGLARNAASIPALFRRLHEDESLEEDCLPALRQINGDEVARRAAEGWLAGDAWFRMSAVELLMDVHSDFALAATLDLLRAEPAGDMRCMLGAAALRQFSPEACELLRDEVDFCDFKVTFRRGYLAATLLLGIDDPRLERFMQEEEQIRARVRALEESDFAARWNDWYADAEEYDDEDFLDDEDEFDDGPFDRPYPPSAAPLRAQKTAGRNDPCPCGSGKKFKKCCLRKSSIIE